MIIFGNLKMLRLINIFRFPNIPIRNIKFKSIRFQKIFKKEKLEQFRLDNLHKCGREVRNIWKKLSGLFVLFEMSVEICLLTEAALTLLAPERTFLEDEEEDDGR